MSHANGGITAAVGALFSAMGYVRQRTDTSRYRAHSHPMPSPFTTAFYCRYFVLAAIGFGGLAAHGQTMPAPTRGELLYGMHCIACHASEMHWRNNRRAQDWESLKVQVRFWQGNTGLLWNEADIAEVAGYLNDTVYQYPRPAPVGLGLLRPPQRTYVAR